MNRQQGEVGREGRVEWRFGVVVYSHSKRKDERIRAECPLALSAPSWKSIF